MKNLDIETVLKKPGTIDLRYMYAREIVDEIENKWFKNKTLNIILPIFTIIWAITVLVLWWGMLIWKSKANNIETQINSEYDYYWVDNHKDYERKLRLEACERVYMQNQYFVNDTFIHTTQNPIVRCATMMTLVWAYESNYFNSNMCLTTNNCFGIKEYSTWRFKEYNTRYESYLDFARLYLVWNWNNSFKWHKNRTISEFVYNWSMTDRNTYIDYLNTRFHNIYNELNNIY